MTPLYFGPAEASCFGWYHAPRGSTVRDVAVVLCATIGYEAICSHRAMRSLAEHLAEAGFPVLRFDYHGTGDSDGDDGEPARLQAWRASIASAIEAVKSESGAARVSLVGLRLGATLAADVASARDDVASLVLFAPCASGASFVREARAFRKLAEIRGLPPLSSNGDVDAAGFILTRETVASLNTLNWPNDLPRTLVIERDDFPRDEKLLERLTGASNVEIESPRGYAAMMVDPHKSLVPREAIEAIGRWLGRVHGEGVRNEPRMAPRTRTRSTARRSLDRADVIETPVYIGSPRLFAVLSRPRVPGPRAKTCVILLNPGSVHHIGCNRMHVTWARKWAAAGLSVARLDLAGIGDSDTAPDRKPNETHSPRSVPDVQALMNEVARTHGIERFVLCGVCSGAYVSFRAALEGGRVAGEEGAHVIAGVIPINPQRFHHREGMSFEFTPGHLLHESKRYRDSFVRFDKWRKLLRGEVQVRSFARIMTGRATLSVRAKLGALRARLPGAPPGPHHIPRDLGAMLERGIDVLLVYSVHDPGWDFLQLHAARAVRSFTKRPNFSVQMVPDADHTFVPIPSQARLEALLTSHLDRVFP